jgi:hypothetical protein
MPANTTELKAPLRVDLESPGITTGVDPVAYEHAVQLCESGLRDGLHFGHAFLLSGTRRSGPKLYPVSLVASTERSRLHLRVFGLPQQYGE